MKKAASFAFPGIDRLFHEPNRLRILSALDDNDGSLSFAAIKGACCMTDGNLILHLRRLETHGVVRIDKAPRNTKVTLTQRGRVRLDRYMAALAEVVATVKSGG